MAQGVDDRTPRERDANDKEYIPKSRYDSISFYISDDPAFKDEYNDYHFPVNKQAMEFATEKAKEVGVELDKAMLQHLGFLMLRDPLVLFNDNLEVNNAANSCHFEVKNICIDYNVCLHMFSIKEYSKYELELRSIQATTSVRQ